MAIYTIIRIYEIPADNQVQATAKPRICLAANLTVNATASIASIVRRSTPLR